MLELDHLHRSRSPLDPELRGRIRWATARANRSSYGEAYALADLRSQGLGKSADQLLAAGSAGLPSDRREILSFAEKMATAPQSVTDAEVAHLIAVHGEKQVVAVVLLLAYAQFQDRLLLALGIPVESGGPIPSLNVRFSRHPFENPALPPRKKLSDSAPTTAVPATSSPFDISGIQCGLEEQRVRKPRIRLPEEDIGANRWGLVGQTYQPELANAWSTCTQAFGEEANQDPVFEQSLFWLVTGAKSCFY